MWLDIVTIRVLYHERDSFIVWYWAEWESNPHLLLQYGLDYFGWVGLDCGAPGGMGSGWGYDCGGSGPLHPAVQANQEDTRCRGILTLCLFGLAYSKYLENIILVCISSLSYTLRCIRQICRIVFLFIGSNLYINLILYP